MTRTQIDDDSIRPDQVQHTSDTIDILHVDDEPNFAELAAEFLEREEPKFNVDTATGVDKALENLSQGKYDCVISDYDMPGRDGIEFLETVRGEFPDIPFILFTGKGSEEVASEAISAGVTDYLQKGSGSDRFVILANRVRNCVERVQAEREREAMRERMDHVLEYTDSIIFEIESDSGIVRRLGNYEDFFEVSPDEAPTWRDHLDEVVHPADREKFREFHERIIDGELESGVLEYRTVPDGNGIHWIRDTVHVRGTGSNKAIGLAQDITEIKEREAALQDEREFISEALNSLRDIFVVVGPEGKLRRWNDRLPEVSGYREADIDNMAVTELFTHEDRDEVADWIDEASKTGYTYAQVDLLTVYGEKIPYEFAGIRMLDATDNFGGIVGAGRKSP